MLSPTYRTGSLEVICGPMFAGKSEELIRRLRRAQIAQQRVAVFKHSIDTRYDQSDVMSHNGTRLKAHATDDSAAILAIVTNENYSVVGIDEIHFYSPAIIDTIRALTDNGVRVIVAGLDLDYRRNPFGIIPTLLAIANTVTKLTAICTNCGKDAYYSRRMLASSDAQVLVGAQESYTAQCRSCYLDQPVASPNATHQQQSA